MIRQIVDWIKQKRRERKRLRNLEFWGYAGPALLHNAPYMRQTKLLKIDQEGKLSYGESEKDLFPLQCDKVDTVCWTGCPHYHSALFFRVFGGGYSFCCRYYPTRIDAETIDAPRKAIGDAPHVDS